ncbi:DUF1168 domain-containing protein [Rhizomicrobium electricum]|jgi:hypothetical protein|uniref:Transcriptional regulator n=1 Tax=Rhizomicrobium electricum TaxID=480070 RepID=A0ABP3PJQ8_9PROT|nr:hypothetical protein [Rhizomicrobium electricum]NIJ48345.1 hypothetical protein [Rhizomicrobium electricum]
MSDDNTKTVAPSAAKRETARRNAMDHFAASERRDTEVRKEIERQQAADAAKTAKLRALRLAKEEADRIAAANAPAPAPKTRKASKPRAR